MVHETSAPTPVGADDKLRSARNQALTVEIVDGRLVVSIGIDALMTAVRGGDDWDDDQYVITDPEDFAASIARGLEDEQEDGTTDIHLAIDKAVTWAIESAEPGVEFRSDIERLDDDGAAS